MAFAQLTYRESLGTSDLPLGPRIETLSHGLPPAGPALDAGRPTKGATGVSMRRWPSGSSPRRGRCTSTKNWGWTGLRPGLDRSVPVGLSVGVPHHQAAVKMHTLLTCGATFRVLSTSRMASCTTFMPSCSCRKPEPSTSWIVTSTLVCCTKPGPSSSRVPSRISSRLFGADGSLDRHHLRPDGFYTRQDYRNFCGAASRPRVR